MLWMARVVRIKLMVSDVEPESLKFRFYLIPQTNAAVTQADLAPLTPF